MAAIARQLLTTEGSSPAEAAKRTLAQSGLTPEGMSKWAETNIIRLLNGKPSRITERVTWIVDACQRVIRLHQSMSLADSERARAASRDALLDEVIQLLKEMNGRLARYKCLPVVRYLGSPHGFFDVQYLFLAASSSAAPERVAISFLMDNIHVVHRIRRCHRHSCRQWFFAGIDRQKYCSDHCRKIDAQQGPEFRKKRAEYMRERYRPTQRKMDADAAAGAMIGRTKSKRKSGRRHAKG